MADSLGLDEEGWTLRYHLEDQIIHLDCVEEEYWRQRSRIKWTLLGDSCTAFFHAMANGRHRKCMIPRLITDSGEIPEQPELVGLCVSILPRTVGVVWGDEGVLTSPRHMALG
jgi:hypothetical protein